MQFSSTLDNEPPAFDFGPAFQYRSAFKYSRIAGSENECTDECSVNRSRESGDRVFNWYQKLIRSIFLFSTYSAVIATFPVSFWFCVKVCENSEACINLIVVLRTESKSIGTLCDLPIGSAAATSRTWIRLHFTLFRCRGHH